MPSFNIYGYVGRRWTNETHLSALPVLLRTPIQPKKHLLCRPQGMKQQFPLLLTLLPSTPCWSVHIVVLSTHHKPLSLLCNHELSGIVYTTANIKLQYCWFTCIVASQRTHNDRTLTNHHFHHHSSIPCTINKHIALSTTTHPCLQRHVPLVHHQWIHVTEEDLWGKADGVDEDKNS